MSKFDKKKHVVAWMVTTVDIYGWNISVYNRIDFNSTSTIFVHRGHSVVFMETIFFHNLSRVSSSFGNNFWIVLLSDKTMVSLVIISKILLGAVEKKNESCVYITLTIIE
jgi:hypothetical protein